MNIHLYNNIYSLNELYIMDNNKGEHVFRMWCLYKPKLSKKSSIFIACNTIQPNTEIICYFMQ